MADYTVYRDFGDFGTHHTCAVPNLFTCLNRLVKEGGAPSEFTVRLMGDHLATLTLHPDGRYTAEVLDRREYSPHTAYAVNHWHEYHRTAAGHWVRSAPVAVED